MADLKDAKKREIEILAPAGSFETFQAVIRAGADAVYLGGSRFGARAYANNFGGEELLRAIDYAHVHGRQVYLTVNTLFKEDELEDALYDYLLPYYKQGLDAVIVQDLGAFSLIKDAFPGLDIHTSTQMTVTGCEGAAYLKELGASRLVTAREMSLAEIGEIREKVDVELETFVHGALCYCYSGQCLLSSMLGGRSGNRGRCAQPCRLSYEVFDADKKSVKTRGNYILSPKDMCGVSDIPALFESGVYSLKIEGRMKQAEYAAGVVSVYRHYADLYLNGLAEARESGKSEEDARTCAREHFKVTEADLKRLMEFGNRSGFTNGYYYKKNGSDMITFGKPNHTKANEALQGEIREKYVRAGSPDDEIKEKIKGILRLKKDSPATIEVIYGERRIQKTGDVVQAALKQPLSREKIETAIKKTGSTPFVFAELVIEMEEDIFLAVQALNQLRRDALEALEAAVLQPYRRDKAESAEDAECSRQPSLEAAGLRKKERRVPAGQPAEYGRRAQPEAEEQKREYIIVSIERRTQLAPVLAADFVDAVYLDSSIYERADYTERLCEDVQAVHAAEKQAFLILPAVFRNHTARFYESVWEALLAAGIDGVMVKSLDAAGFIRARGETEHLRRQESGAERQTEDLRMGQRAKDAAVVLDHSIYSWNNRAKRLLRGLDPLRDTAPLELNKRELIRRDNCGSELLIYGNLPLMTTAQCVHANTGKCDKKMTVTYLKDRCGKYFPVKNNCAECYNIVYNTTPLLLFSHREELLKMGFAAYRLAFTTESEKEVRQMLHICKDTFLLGREDVKDVFFGEYTYGHYKRGVE